MFGLVTLRDLVRVIDSDRYPFSSRIRTLGAILAKLKPEPVRELLPPRKHHQLPRFTRGRRARR